MIKFDYFYCPSCGDETIACTTKTPKVFAKEPDCVKSTLHSHPIFICECYNCNKLCGGTLVTSTGEAFNINDKSWKVDLRAIIALNVELYKKSRNQKFDF